MKKDLLRNYIIVLNKKVEQMVKKLYDDKFSNQMTI